MSQINVDVRSAEGIAELERVERNLLFQLHDIRRKLDDEFVLDAIDALDDLRISVRKEFGRLRADSHQGTHS